MIFELHSGDLSGDGFVVLFLEIFELEGICHVLSRACFTQGAASLRLCLVEDLIELVCIGIIAARVVLAFEAEAGGEPLTILTREDLVKVEGKQGEEDTG